MTVIFASLYVFLTKITANVTHRSTENSLTLLLKSIARATYSLVTNLLADYSLICRLR